MKDSVFDNSFQAPSTPQATVLDNDAGQER